MSPTLRSLQRFACRQDIRSVTHGEHSAADIVDRYTRINWQARVAAVGSIEVEVGPMATVTKLREVPA